MRTRAIIAIATFYLLLSTGMFACVLGCGSETLIKLFTFVPSHAQHEHNKKDACQGTKDCPCCDKHGKFEVKDNLKPESQPALPQVPSVAYLKKETRFIEPLAPVQTLALKRFLHPPSLTTSSIPLFISLRSILI